MRWPYYYIGPQFYLQQLLCPRKSSQAAQWAAQVEIGQGGAGIMTDEDISQPSEELEARPMAHITITGADGSVVQYDIPEEESGYLWNMRRMARLETENATLRRVLTECKDICDEQQCDDESGAMLAEHLGTMIDKALEGRG